MLIKLSGEALQGKSAFGIDPQELGRFAEEIQQVVNYGTRVAMVIGGGNLFRGKVLESVGINRMTGDHMGMLATVMNSLAMRDTLEMMGVPTCLMSAISMRGLADDYDRRKAIRHLERGRVLLFAAGTGNPLVTTDSAASLRAIEMGVDVLVKATQVDGIYDRDPLRYPDAVRYDELGFDEALSKELGVMDLAAFCQCRDHKMPIRVVNVHQKGALLSVAKGEKIGTLVTV